MKKTINFYKRIFIFAIDKQFDRKLLRINTHFILTLVFLGTIYAWVHSVLYIIGFFIPALQDFSMVIGLIDIIFYIFVPFFGVGFVKICNRYLVFHLY